MADFLSISNRIGLPDHMQIRRLDPDNLEVTVKSFTVLVNPESYEISYANCFSEDQAIGDTDTLFYFNKAKAQNMSINLLFDSTGSLGKIPLIGNQSVLEQVEAFLDVAYTDQNQFADKKVMQLVWGPMQFLGLLSSVKIGYTHFDSTGAPIRATATCKFIGGNINFDRPEKANNPLQKKGKKRKVVDYGKQKHAINAVLKYSSYLAVIAQQPEEALPKTLRKAAEVAKLIIK